MRSNLNALRILISLLVFQVALHATETPRPTNHPAINPTNERRTKVVRLSTSALRARAVQCSVPEYPSLLAQNVRLQGTLTVEVLVDTDGTVRSARAVSGHPLLRASAVQAATKWKFKPLKLKGRPVKFRGFLPFIFSRDKDEMDKQCEGLKGVE
jgi:TonB family protein